MNTELSPEALEVGTVVRELIEQAGGVGVLRAAVDDPSSRIAAEVLLDPVGVWELAPADDQLEFEVAAAVSRAAGSYALPYPVVERLGRIGGVDATALVSERSGAVASHIDLPLAWSAIDLRGAGYSVHGSARLAGAELAPFGVEVETRADGSSHPRAAAVLVTLQAWWMLGLLDTALVDTLRYTGEREQFGQALSKFQAVGFALAEMELAIRSLEELAKYTVWSVARDDQDGLVDALALRVAMQTSADTVLRGAHQLHGAMGFTNEVAVSWLSRASQAPRRLPEGSHRTATLLAELVGRAGLEPFGGGLEPGARSLPAASAASA